MPDKKKSKENREVRTRFAPSPTGLFHVGSARTALFNYIFAKQNSGVFVLRIEDTDKERSKPKFEQDIIENLKWLGLKWDEGPYKQSERLDIYKKYLEKLLKEGKAYYCFCTQEELEDKRQERMSRGLAPKYNGKCARLSKEEIKKNLEKGKEYIIRFKTPFKKIRFEDMVRGKIEFDSKLIGDFSIARKIDSPLYNFVVTIDDFEMKISHVIRGEDLLPNTPKQILLQEALGFNEPKYGHLSLILGPDRSKLSKRHGADSLSKHRELGYLPETLINFLAFLGWNPGTEKEVYSLAGLIKDFSIDRISKSGAVFNIKRLDFLNGFYIRQKSVKKLTELCIPYLMEKDLIEPVFKAQESFPNLTGIMGRKIVQKYIVKETNREIDISQIERIISIYQERLKVLSEISELVDFFFKDKIEYDKSLLVWKNSKDTKSSIDKIYNMLSGIKDWKKENIEKVLMPEAEKTGDRGYLLWPLRASLTGKKSSAGPFETAEALGKEKTLKRIKEAIIKLS